MSLGDGHTRLASALICLSVAFAGCAPARSLFTPAADYAAYRSTRVAPTFDERIAAAATYLDRFPEGDYAAEVRGYLAEAEPAFYAVKRGSIAGLEAYLRALPKGDHREDVTADLRSRRTARDDREELRSVTSMGARLTVLSAQRVRVRTEIDKWVSGFLDPQVTERPMAEAPADLIIPWALALPAPVCAVPEGAPPEHARRCAKIVELPYTVASDGGPEERQATIEIAVTEDAVGRPLQITIGGPELFLRLEETYSARAVASDDAAARVNAAARAVELVQRAFEARLDPGPDCRKPPASPVVLHFACKGLRVTVRAPSSGAEDDLISITKL